MAVPKKKTTKSAKNQRRSHHGLDKPELTQCSNCKKPVKPHHVCINCGYYKGEQIIEIKTEEEKKLSKKERKQAMAKEKGEDKKEELPEKVAEKNKK